MTTSGSKGTKILKKSILFVHHQISLSSASFNSYFYTIVFPSLCFFQVKSEISLEYSINLQNMSKLVKFSRTHSKIQQNLNNFAAFQSILMWTIILEARLPTPINYYNFFVNGNIFAFLDHKQWCQCRVLSESKPMVYEGISPYSSLVCIT